MTPIRVVQPIYSPQGKPALYCPLNALRWEDVNTYRLNNMNTPSTCQCGFALAVWWQILSSAYVLPTKSIQNAAALCYYCAQYPYNRRSSQTNELQSRGLGKHDIFVMYAQFLGAQWWMFPGIRGSDSLRHESGSLCDSEAGLDPCLHTLGWRASPLFREQGSKEFTAELDATVTWTLTKVTSGAG